MNRLSIAMVALWACGLVLGSMSERPGGRAPRSYDGLQVLSADFHVHSFPGDGALPPWSLAAEARRRGLDVVALTNHNQMLSWALTQRLDLHPNDVTLLPGEEVTTPEFHATAIGIDRTVRWDRSPDVVAARVHAAHGVVIAAHPDDRAADTIDHAFASFDGVESAHPIRYASDLQEEELDVAIALALTEHAGIAQIGASDFHYLAPIGLCRTYVFARAATLEAILEAIRAGRTVACDAQGRVYGPERLSRFVAEDCRAAQTRSDRHGRLNAVAVWGCWLATFGLVIGGPTRRPQPSGIQ